VLEYADYSSIKPTELYDIVESKYMKPFQIYVAPTEYCLGISGVLLTILDNMILCPCCGPALEVVETTRNFLLALQEAVQIRKLKAKRSGTHIHLLALHLVNSLIV
jgi:hypothetical protein